jgi:hypothetical protein
VFRRNSSEAPGVIRVDESQPDADQDQPVRPAVTPKKGAPTPKRSEAEANRRGPYRAPTDRKGAAQDSKQRSAADRTRRAEAMRRGDLPKDRGPVRSLARDVVDARRGVSEYYLLAVLPIFVLLFIHTPDIQLIADAIVVAILLIVLSEGYYVGRKVERLASERFPGESRRGLKLYTAMRGMQMRRLRMPKPRVNRGDQV